MKLDVTIFEMEVFVVRRSIDNIDEVHEIFRLKEDSVQFRKKSII